MPDDVIATVHRMARRKKANPGLIFADLNRNVDPDDDMDNDDDDSKYHTRDAEYMDDDDDEGWEYNSDDDDDDENSNHDEPSTDQNDVDPNDGRSMRAIISKAKIDEAISLISNLHGAKTTLAKLTELLLSLQMT